jgi:ATP-dependent helicase STH1/SNF2
MGVLMDDVSDSLNGTNVKRWNALKSQNVREKDHAELREITRVLKLISVSQKLYNMRNDNLNKLRKSSTKTKKDPQLVRAQIQSFNLLSRNLDIPGSIQQTLLDSLGIESGGVVDDESSDEDEYEFSKRFDGLVKEDEVQPDSSAVGGTAEVIIRNRLAHRIAELERLPANIGTLDTKALSFSPQDVISPEEDQLKLKAVIELKALRLLTKQKSLRQHVVYSIASKADSLSESMTCRALHRRVKVQTAQELRLTEQLEREQRLERERRERLARLQFVANVCNHVGQFRENFRTKKARGLALNKSIMQAHSQIEREESKRSERTARQRLQALKANDEDAYIKLLDQTKDTRITHLLKQTNAFLDSLSQAVRRQQEDANAVVAPPMDDEEREKVDYYEVAHRVKEHVTRQPTMLVGGKLKEYQVKGLQWMVSLYNNNLNGILADEMGLGKTIQSISLIAYLIETKRQPGPYLVIVPLSTLTNWNIEFEKWAPSIKKVVYKGPPNARKSQQGVIRSGDFQVLLTTYEYIIKDRPILSKIKWTHMIIDEGHRMKNSQSKLSSTLTQYYYSRHRLILTGTPLQNNLPELWALLNFVLPKIFNSVKTFDEWFNTPFANTGGQDKIELTEEETLLVIRRLHKVLRPFLLRRLKKDVEKDLPDKVEKVIKCKMSAIQSKLYEQMLKHNVLFIGDSGMGGKSKMSIRGLNNRVMQLRKICNHPYVFEEVENLINPSRANNDDLWRVSGKFELLDRIFPKFQCTNHRVLMFFQMTQVMDIMEDYLRLKGIQYLRLDGSTKADDRTELLRLFNAPESPYFCFLLSTRAGGLGLNLQTADTVIIYDTDWNPHQDLQAQDRAHRIGQTKEVRILRLITEDSVEEAILSRAAAKLDIDGKVIQAGKFDNKSTAEEQEAFLRSLLEAEDMRRGGNDEDEDLDDDELNEILARSEDEHALFKQMDEELIANGLYGRDKEKDRLFGEDEMPEEYNTDIREYLEPMRDEALGRGARERKQVYYDDGLTEEQFLDAVDKDAGALEKAIERKRLRREKRVDKLKLKLVDGDETDGSKRKRDDETDSVADSVDDSDTMPIRPAKRISRKSKLPVDDLTPEARQNLTEDSMRLYDTVLNCVDAKGRHRADIFLELPSKRLYPDYYMLISNPLSLDIIKRRIDIGHYMSIEEVKAAFDLMFGNARTYNEPGSFVHQDAVAIDEEVRTVYNEIAGQRHRMGTKKLKKGKKSLPLLKLKLSTK